MSQIRSIRFDKYDECRSGENCEIWSLPYKVCSNGLGLAKIEVKAIVDLF